MCRSVSRYERTEETRSDTDPRLLSFCSTGVPRISDRLLVFNVMSYYIVSQCLLLRQPVRFESLPTSGLKRWFHSVDSSQNLLLIHNRKIRRLWYIRFRSTVLFSIAHTPWSVLTYTYVLPLTPSVTTPHSDFSIRGQSFPNIRSELKHRHSLIVFQSSSPYCTSLDTKSCHWDLSPLLNYLQSVFLGDGRVQGRDILLPQFHLLNTRNGSR